MHLLHMLLLTHWAGWSARLNTYDDGSIGSGATKQSMQQPCLETQE